MMPELSKQPALGVQVVESLTEANIEAEIRLLREDMLNWDHGHPMEAA